MRARQTDNLSANRANKNQIGSPGAEPADAAAALLRPNTPRAQAVRNRLQRLGITERDVQAAIVWARR